MGPQLDAASAVDRRLVRFAGRATQLSDAVVALCRQGHPSEALPVLRQLGETAASLCWLAAGPSEDRARALAKESEDAAWSALWPQERFLSRAQESGFAESARQVLDLCRDFVDGGTLTLPWAHVFEGRGARGGLCAKKVLELAAAMMGHVLKALGRRWPGDFPGAEQVWPP